MKLRRRRRVLPPVAELLRRADAFRTLDQHHLDRLAAAARVYKLQRGESAARLEAAQGDVWLVASGALCLCCVSDHGKHCGLTVLCRGDLCGELALLGTGAYPRAVHVLEDSVIVTLPAGAFARLLEESHAVSLALTRLLLSRLRTLAQLCGSLAHERLERRLARVLLGLAGRCGVTETRGILLTLPLRRTDVACLTGSGRTAATLALKELERRGVIEWQGRNLIVRRPGALRQMAGRAGAGGATVGEGEPTMVSGGAGCGTSAAAPAGRGPARRALALLPVGIREAAPLGCTETQGRSPPGYRAPARAGRAEGAAARDRALPEDPGGGQ